MASYHVLHDLLKHYEPAYAEYQRKNLTKYGLKNFNKASNFLKHADRDPYASIKEISYEENEYRIGFCIVAFRVITNELTLEFGAFHLMSMMTYPDNFKVAPDSDADIEACARFAAKRAQNDVKLRIKLFCSNRKIMNAGVFPVNFHIKRINDGNS
jgi:hypothetical protein